MKSKKLLAELGTCTGILFFALGAVIASMDLFSYFYYRVASLEAIMLGIVISLIGLPFFLASRRGKSKEQGEKERVEFLERDR